MANKMDAEGSPDAVFNWTALHSVLGSNNTTSNSNVSSNDEFDDLRYGMTTTIVLM